MNRMTTNNHIKKTNGIRNHYIKLVGNVKKISPLIDSIYLFDNVDDILERLDGVNDDIIELKYILKEKSKYERNLCFRDIIYKIQNGKIKKEIKRIEKIDSWDNELKNDIVKNLLSYHQEIINYIGRIYEEGFIDGKDYEKNRRVIK